ELIRREIENRREGKPARIVAKMNQREDPEMIEALCEASAAGVPVDLIIRGFCSHLAVLRFPAFPELRQQPRSTCSPADTGSEARPRFDLERPAVEAGLRLPDQCGCGHPCGPRYHNCSGTFRRIRQASWCEVPARREK